MGEEDYTILVDLKEPQSQPDYYIFKTTDLDHIIEDDFEIWLRLRVEMDALTTPIALTEHYISPESMHTTLLKY